MPKRQWKYSECKQILIDLLQGESVASVAKRLHTYPSTIESRIGHLRRALSDAAELNAQTLQPSAAELQEHSRLRELTVKWALGTPAFLREREFILRQVRKIEITSELLGRPLVDNTFAPEQNPGLAPLPQAELQLS